MFGERTDPQAERAVMLMIRCDIQNEKVILSGLGTLADRFPAAVKKTLEKATIWTFRNAQDWLMGASSASPGSYPIPRRSSRLKDLLFKVFPGETKASQYGSITAGQTEAVVGDSAAYATTVFLGKGSSAKFGERNAIVDAFKQFNGGEAGNKLGEMLDKEITAEAKRIGLA
jgi:hypothetical protein